MSSEKSSKNEVNKVPALINANSMYISTHICLFIKHVNLTLLPFCNRPILKLYLPKIINVNEKSGKENSMPFF